MKPTDIIKKDYLRNFLLWLLVIFFVGTAVSALLLYIDIYRPLNAHYSAILSTLKDVKESLVTKTVRINAIFYLLITAGIGILVIFYTHRIAGPLHRIKQHAKSIGQGHLDAEITFRQRDAINSLAESLNDLTKNYSDKVAILSSEIRQLKIHIIELKSLTERGENTEAAAEKIAGIDSRIKNLLNTIKL